MKIEVEGISKKYHRSFLFKDLNFSLKKGESYALLGANGSGKSTLLKIISGFVIPTQGKVMWYDDNELEIEKKHYHKYFSFTSPYLELFEELTLTEQLKLHFKLKPIVVNRTIKDIIEIANFEKDKKKQLKHFSSGMMQRLKLCLALFTDVPILLLDEPCTNLDDKGIQWYRDLISNHHQNKLVIIASNQTHEYDFCKNTIDLNHP